MTTLESATPDYTVGFSDEMLESLRRFTAETHAKHLLPYLRRGLRILDFGCGPGTISVGLAKAVDPGELHGVDMEASQINLVRAIAQERRQENTIFHLGDVTALPFEDGFFDVAHCHNVLMHVPDTQAVLTEVRRVLKPGGIIACRELICESSSTHPDFGIMEKSWGMFQDLLQADDGHPQIGKELKGHILAAGFENVRATTFFDVYGTSADVAFIHFVITGWFLSPEVIEVGPKYGVSTPQIWERIRAAADRWKDAPEATLAIAWGEAVANKP